jgi:mannose-6-phosphate isomerase-like protein (cupin superfamily)
MTNDLFEEKHLSDVTSSRADDGSEVFPLCRLSDKASTALWQLEKGEVSRAVRSRTVEEIWYVVAGSGAMWRRQDDREKTVELTPGLSLTVPGGTTFQFKASDDESLHVLGATIPSYPIGSEDEVIVEQGPWTPRVGSS